MDQVVVKKQPEAAEKGSGISLLYICCVFCVRVRGAACGFSVLDMPRVIDTLL